jgi:hypothetical protein
MPSLERIKIVEDHRLSQSAASEQERHRCEDECPEDLAGGGMR